jgi:hypothetical protein
MASEEQLNKLETRHYTKKEAARRQIDVAIRVFYEGEYESAITLACAAEGMMGESEHPHVFAVLKGRKPGRFETEAEWVTFLNETRDWLKHLTPQLGDTRGIAQFEAWVSIARAVTKFYGVYLEETVVMNEFIEWGREHGLTVKV